MSPMNKVNREIITRVKQALNHLQQHKMVLLTDAHDRENEADFIASAKTITHQQLNMMRVHGSGVICVAITKQMAEQLDLPLLLDQSNNQNQQQTPFAMSVEAAHGITTGVSIADRLQTIKLFSNNDVAANDFVRPGHVFPLVAHEQGLRGRQGHTEGSLELLQLSGDANPAVICEAVDADGQALRGQALQDFAALHDLPLISIADIRYYQQHYLHFSSAILPTEFGKFYMRVYQDQQQQDYTVLSSKPFAEWSNHVEPPLVRLHSACFTGDVLGSRRCDCGDQLTQALQLIQRQNGLLLYLPQEGRGIGLYQKIQAYQLQEQGLDTVQANQQLHLPVDARSYSFAANLLKDIGVQQMKLITNNPEKIKQCENYGINVVECVQIHSPVNPHNQFYLQTKIEKMQHHLMMPL